LFCFYKLNAGVYGIKYKKEENYVFRCRDIKKDIKRLFYICHYDVFTAGQFNSARETADLLCYEEMNRKINSV